MTVEIVKTICEILKMFLFAHNKKSICLFLLFALANVSGLGKWLSANVHMNNYQCYLVYLVKIDAMNNLNPETM